MLQRKSTYVLFLLTFLFFSLTTSATTYYLSSSSGNDSNSGTSASSPWKTLNKLNSFRNLQPGDNVLFRRGDIFYGSITISNSGTSGSPITFSAYGSGNKPVITGFTPVSSWTSLGGNIWESSNPVSTLPYTNMVVVNGNNTAMGRYPNCTSPNTGYLTINSHSGNTSITCTGLSGSPNWTGASIVIRKKKYYLQRGTITGQSGSTIYYKDPGSDPTDGYGFFIQNDPRTLDINGEWYYNPSTKKLRIYSTSYPTDVKVASVEKLVNVSGAYVTFDNLNLTGANSYAVSATYSSMQHVAIQNCDILFSGIDAIYSDQPSIIVQNNNISDANSDGIKIVQGNGIVKNNKITSICVFEGMAQENSMGGICVNGSNTTIQNNTIIKSGFKGIIFSGTGTKVKNNVVNTFCFVREDGAGIYTGNNGSAGSVIDGNIILNGLGAKNGSLGDNDLSAISVDDFGTGITISNNTMANCVTVGLKLHKANNIIVKNNTAYNNGSTGWSKGGIEILYNSSYPPTNINLTGNILFAKSSVQLPVFASSPSGETDGIKLLKADYNYYAKPIQENTLFKVNGNFYDLSTWKSYTGQDLNSKNAPKTISNLSDLTFQYNASSQSKTIPLDASYIDAKGNKFDGSITLAPYSSAVLIKDGASTNLLPAVNPSNAVNGLNYKYYEAASYSTLPDFNSITPVKTGTSNTFDISLANGNSSYSFNFTGYIDVPADGQYTFYTTSDDGSNLYIDNVPVVNNDGLHGAVEKSGTIGLKAGKHAISVGFFQQGGDQVLSVSYAGPGVSKQIIPNSSLYRVSTSNLLPAVNPSNTINGLNYKYFEASSYSKIPDFTSVTPVKTGISHNFDISFANRDDYFSFNFTGYIQVPADGQYTFYTNSDDGSNLYIDNVLVVDNDGLHSATEKSGRIGLKAGKHTISVGYFELNGDNILSVSYAGPGINKQPIPSAALYKIANFLPAVYPTNIVGGLNYKYYESSYYGSLPNFNSFTPVKTGSSNTFDISVANRSTSYSLKFDGYIDVPADGQYTFYTKSDDGSNLYIDNVLIVDNDGLHSSLEKSGIIELKAGKHAVSVGFFQQLGDNILSVSYESAGIAKQTVPSSLLYRSSSTALAGQTMINSSTGMMFENDPNNFQMQRLLNSRQTTTGVKVYPNPFRNSIQIDVNGGDGSKFKLVLTDASGKIVWTKNVKNDNSSYHESVNTSTLPIGVYFLNLIRNNKSSVTKLVKEY